MVASIVAPYILSMWTAQWPCFRQHVKAACRSTTFEVFQGDFAAVNPTGGGDTTLLYENETAIIFSHCVFSTKIIFYFFYVYSDRVRNTLTAQERRSGDHLWPECAAARGDSAQLCEADSSRACESLQKHRKKCEDGCMTMRHAENRSRQPGFVSLTPRL